MKHQYVIIVDPFHDRGNVVVPATLVTISPRSIPNPCSPEGIVADWAERNIASNLIQVFKECVTFP